ncbi:MAG: hypothetical protein JRI23_18845 [Deltaproteobacteria bacterium]|jgi:hypothetical protein|nr:hypothetical protein [Deltaproteobacteria bacterium]MBW2533922.1 hypothetical protein [Deltaproteobacteria bacterium]
MLTRVARALSWGCCLVVLVGHLGCGDDEVDRSPPATGGAGGDGASAGLAGTGGTAGTAGTSATGGTGSTVSGDIVGYWVYSRYVTDGQTVYTRDDDVDLRYTPGEGEGLHKYAFGANGRAHYIYNTPTLSDYNHPGTYELQSGMLLYHEIEKYSCAHPDHEHNNAPNETTTYAWYEMRDGELWLTMNRTTGFNNTTLHPSPPDESLQGGNGQWMVLEQVSQTDWYGRYMVRVCQATPEYPCHEDCSSVSLLGE